ncbi:MAG TPA: glycerophosphodiester phosphodiesterase, partial [Spirochaetia bacterium]|nr:glycerophosphodiester phosphodiesterase [Spirochaetia bacterium]
AGNTLRSIEAAVAFGVDLVEVDVHRTRDNRLVLWHDEGVPSPEGELDIASESFESLKTSVQNEIGEELIDLGRAIELTRGVAGLMIDLKAEGLTSDIVSVVQSAGYTPAVICGEYWDELRFVLGSAPAIGASLTLNERWDEQSGPRIEEIDTPAVTVAWPVVNRIFVERMHERGIAVLVWTVDEPELMRRMLNLGVDGLTSNRPDLFRTL